MKSRTNRRNIGAAVFSGLLLLWPVRSPANQSRQGAGQSSRENSAPSEARESRAGILRAVSTVGLILVRNSFDPVGQAPRPRGSGVVVRIDGVIVTNLHVIAHDDSPALYSELFFSVPENGMAAQSASRRYRIKPVLIKREYDLALLRIASDADGQPLPPTDVLPAIQFGDSRAVELLEKLVIIGFPEGGGASVTVNEGVVEGKDIAGNWIKTSARLIHGNSGGAAVDSEGRLIGIPTKVVIDKSLVEKNAGVSPNRRGIYDAASVGFLRPAHLVRSMLGKVEVITKEHAAAPTAGAAPRIDGAQMGGTQIESAQKPGPRQTVPQSAARAAVIVRGVVRAADDHRPIAGARVGIVPLGVSDITPANLIAWGGTNAEGRFELNKPAAPGRYTIKVRALGYQDFVGDVIVGQEPVVVEMHGSK